MSARRSRSGGRGPTWPPTPLIPTTPLGEPAGFSKLAAPFMAKAMRGANQKDLQRLKKILEAGNLAS
jgi:hypothetical protein